MCPPGRHVHRTADSPVGGPLGGCHLSAMAHTVVGQSCPAFSMSLRVVWGCVPPGWGSGMKGGYRMQTSLSTSEGFPGTSSSLYRISHRNRGVTTSSHLRQALGSM